MVAGCHPKCSRLSPYVSQAVTVCVAGNALLLALLPTHFFYHLLYYTDSAATCRLQPYAIQAATICNPGCHTM